MARNTKNVVRNSDETLHEILNILRFIKYCAFKTS